MDLLSQLRLIDVELFRFINEQMVSYVLDVTMPVVTGTGLWALLAALLLFIVRVKSQSYHIFLFAFVLLVCAGISDLLSFQVFKHLFSRLRP